MKKNILFLITITSYIYIYSMESTSIQKTQTPQTSTPCPSNGENDQRIILLQQHDKLCEIIESSLDNPRALYNLDDELVAFHKHDKKTFIDYCRTNGCVLIGTAKGMRDFARLHDYSTQERLLRTNQIVERLRRLEKYVDKCPTDDPLPEIKK